VINNLFALMNEHGQSIETIQVTPAGLGELLEMIEQGAINSSTAKEVLAEMFCRGQSATAVVAAKGLAQISDEAAIAAVIQRLLADNPDEVAAYQSGKTQLLGWFVGQVMQATRGKANPALANRLLRTALG
jgi:aspartyl-tRNA(Asn)/glutamyl-tRNA(Gln) amidotransferase subunit B